jgi:MFS family permease
MTFLLAMLGGAVGATLGWVIAALLTIWIGGLAGVSDFEGGRGMLAVFGIGPIGGLIGLVLGIWLTLRWRGERGLPRLGLKIPLVIAAIGALAAGGFWLALEQRTGLGTSSSGTPTLELELRLPKGISPPEKGSTIKVMLSTEHNHMPGLIFDRRRREGDRTILTGSVELHYRSSWRILEVTLEPGATAQLFTLPLAARPGRMRELSAWRPADHIARPGAQPEKAPAGEAFDIRYRIVYRDEETKAASGGKP